MKFLIADIDKNKKDTYYTIEDNKLVKLDKIDIKRGFTNTFIPKELTKDLNNFQLITIMEEEDKQKRLAPGFGVKGSTLQ